MECTNLKKVEMPNTVTNMMNLAFYDCSSLIDINLSSGLKNINSYEEKKKYNDIIRKYNKLKKTSIILLGIYVSLLILSFIF